jgi:hypothetical protein
MLTRAQKMILFSDTLLGTAQQPPAGSQFVTATNPLTSNSENVTAPNLFTGNTERVSAPKVF